MRKSPGDGRKISAQQANSEIIQAWMIGRLARELNITPAEIDSRKPLLSYGLDSVVAFSLTGELAEWLGHDLPATLFWDHPTLKALASYLAEEMEEVARGLTEVEALSEEKAERLMVEANTSKRNAVARR